MNKNQEYIFWKRRNKLDMLRVVVVVVVMVVVVLLKNEPHVVHEKTLLYRKDII